MNSTFLDFYARCNFRRAITSNYSGKQSSGLHQPDSLVGIVTFRPGFATNHISLQAGTDSRGYMQKRRLPSLSILFLTLISLSLFAFLTKRSAPASRETIQVQTVEQERMAALYFRVLSFLSDVLPKKTTATPPASPRSEVKKTGITPAARGKMELCTFVAEHDNNGNKCSTQNPLAKSSHKPSQTRCTLIITSEFARDTSTPLRRLRRRAL